MAAYTGSQPEFTTANATSFSPPTYGFPLNWPSQSTATYAILLRSYTGEIPVSFETSVRPLTSTNLQAYTTYPKIP